MAWQRALYSLLMYLLLPIFLLRLYWRGRANPAYRQRIAERLGMITVPTQPQSYIWLHAVSVGETMAARPLIEAILRDYPQYTLWITSTTPTGSEMVQRLFAGRVQHSYLPYDLLYASARFLSLLQPKLFIVMETELWPNLYHLCQQRHIPIVLANARLSARSTRGYTWIRGLIAPTLACINIIAARSTSDAVHFQQLGAQAQQCQVIGNIKFDLQLDKNLSTKAQQLRQQWGRERLVWVAGSTHAGEDELLLSVFSTLRQSIPTLLLIIVPRHPERFQAVAELCQQQDFIMQRRSDNPIFSQCDILLGDTMGELLLWYACADIAFIGGSLVNHGGHNPLEAAAFNIPIITGPYIHNFTDIYPLLIEKGGAVISESECTLQHQLQEWFQQENPRILAGKAAGQVFRENNGAVKRLTQVFKPLI